MTNDNMNMNLETEYTFRGVDYAVSVSAAENQLSVEVQDQYNMESWRSEFNSSYIEDLTHKTGNFKQFNIFVNMLGTALNKSSEAVTLDLLTYADLESLRNRRHGSSSRPASVASSKSSKSSVLNTKRYLILTYTVEFDRIHYPLPLTYQGEADSRSLQDTVRQLRSQLSQYKSQSIHLTPSESTDDLRKLKADYAMLIEERDQLEDGFSQYRREVKLPKGNHARELKTLKTMVKHLEEELLKERTKYKKLASKKASECKQLLEELDECRASERNLRVRVKSLTNELGFYKRNRVHSPSTSVSQSAGKKAGSHWSRDLHSRTHSRSCDREMPPRRPRSNSRERFFTTRNESSPSFRQSQERMRRSQERVRSSMDPLRRSAERMRSKERRVLAPLRSRSPSPNAGKPRFDPTAYVREKRRKQQESSLRTSREIRSSQGGSAERRPNSSPGYVNSIRRSNSGIRRFMVRSASVDSLTSQNGNESRYGPLPPVFRSSRDTKRRDSPNIPYTTTRNSAKKTKFTSESMTKRSSEDRENHIPTGAQPSDYLATTDEISEIDARLKRLQHYMSSNLMIKT